MELFLLMLEKMHTLKHPRVYAAHGVLAVLIKISHRYPDNKLVGVALWIHVLR